MRPATNPATGCAVGSGAAAGIPHSRRRSRGQQHNQRPSTAHTPSPAWVCRQRCRRDPVPSGPMAIEPSTQNNVSGSIPSRIRYALGANGSRDSEGCRSNRTPSLSSSSRKSVACPSTPRTAIDSPLHEPHPLHRSVGVVLMWLTSSHARLSRSAPAFGRQSSWWDVPGQSMGAPTMNTEPGPGVVHHV